MPQPYHRGAPPAPPADAPTLFNIAPIHPVPHAGRGMGWEERLDEQHKIYKNQGWYVKKQYTRTIPQGDGIAKIVGNAPPDYWLARAAVWIVADAKSWSSSPRWPLEQVAHHLAQDLTRAQAAGGVAGIILDYHGAGWWLPWAEVGPRWWRWHEGAGRAAAGAASLGVAELAEVGERFGGADWLSVALR